MPLLASFNPSTSSVSLTGTGIPNILGMPVYVERKLPTDLTWEGVRSGFPVGVSGSGFQIFDYEFTPNVQNDYRVRADFVYDSFSRTRTDTWGYNDAGQLYTQSNGSAANWDVNGASGTYTMADAVNTFGQQTLNAVSLQDTDYYGQFTFPVAVTGGSVSVTFLQRVGGTSATALVLTLNTTGQLDALIRGANNTVNLNANGTASPTVASVVANFVNTAVFVRFRAVGTSLQAKIWTGGVTSEPAAWTIYATDTVAATPGYPGVQANRNTGNTNASPVLSFDNIHIADLGTVSPNPRYSYLGGDTFLMDTFTRTVANGWGVSDSGSGYALSGAAANYDVSAANGGRILNLTTTPQTALVNAPGVEQDVYLDIRNPQAALTQPIQGGPVVRYVDASNNYRAVASFTTAGNIDLIIAKSVAGVATTIATQTTAVATYSLAAFYRVRFQVKGTLLRAKIWLSTASEPAGWNLDILDASLAPAGAVGARAVLVTGNTNVTPELRFDNLSAANVVDTAYESITPIQTGVWLKFPLRPNLNREIELCNWSPERRAARGTLFEVQGRMRPVAVTDVRRSREFDVIIKADDSTEAEAIELVMSTGDVIYLQTPGPSTICGLTKRRYPAEGYFYVGDLLSTRVVDGRFTQTLEAQFTEVAAPDPSVGGGTTTWQGIINNFATWAAVQAAFATWQAVQNFNSPPSDLVVG